MSGVWFRYMDCLYGVEEVKYLKWLIAQIDLINDLVLFYGGDLRIHFWFVAFACVQINININMV